MCQSLAGSAASACFISFFVLCGRTQTFPPDTLRVWGRTERVCLRAGLRSLPWPQRHGTQRLSWRRYLGSGSVCGICPCLLSEKQVAPLKGCRTRGSHSPSSHSPVAGLMFFLTDCPTLLTLSRTPVPANSNSSSALMWFLENFFVSTGLFFFFHFLQLPIFF